MNAATAAVTADAVGEAMRLLAGVVADQYGDAISDQDQIDIRIAVRAALDRTIADGYAYARTVMLQAGAQRRRQEQREACNQGARPCSARRPCVECRRRASKVDDLGRSRSNERDRLRFGRAR